MLAVRLEFDNRPEWIRALGRTYPHAYHESPGEADNAYIVTKDNKERDEPFTRVAHFNNATQRGWIDVQSDSKTKEQSS